MDILKPDNKTMKFLGVFLPQRDFVFLTIYSLAKGCNKSQLVRQVITDWVQTHQDKNLLDAIVDRVKAQWVKHSAGQDSSDVTIYKEFKQDVKTTLTDRGLEASDIEYIMNAL